MCLRLLDLKVIRHFVIFLLLAIEAIRHLTHYSCLFAPSVPLLGWVYAIHILHRYYGHIRQSHSLPLLSPSRVIQRVFALFG